MPQFAEFAQAAAWLKLHPAVRFVDLLLADQMGIPRGKRVTVEELEGVHVNGLLLPGSMFALDVLGGTVQSTGLGFDEGDADRVCLPIPGTLVQVPWLGEHVAQMQVTMFDHDRTPFHGDPRHVLENVVSPLHRTWPQAGDGGGTRVLPRRPRAHGRRATRNRHGSR